MRIHEFILAALTISFVVVCASLLITTMSIEYGVDNNQTTDKFSAIYDNVNETFGIASDVNDDVLAADVSENAPWESMILGAYSSIKLVRNSFEMLGDIMADVAKEVGIPAFVIQFAITALMIMIIFAIIYLLFRVKG